MTALVSARVDKATKQQFKTMCESAGITQSVALGMIVKNVVDYRGFPFGAGASPKKRAAAPDKTAVRPPFEFGSMAGKVWMADDFDAPLDDFKEYME